MANEGVSHSEAKSICDKLECSPSQHDISGHQGGKPSINPMAKSGEATSGKEKTSEFKMSDRGRTLPNYTGRFAKKAEQV